MKKIIMTLCILLGSLTLWGQTNFRSINYAEALKAAKTENKLVFIDFYTTWCGPCKMMMKNVFPQPQVGDYFNNKYVCIKLDAEKEGKELAKRLGVKAYPTFFVMDSEGKIKFKKEGGNFDGTKFVAEIEAGINPNLTPERVKERYIAGERTPELVESYANLKLKEARQGRRMNQELVEEAMKVVSDYFNGLTEEQKLSAANTFLYSYTFTQSIADPKAEYMIANIDKFDVEAKKNIEKYVSELYQIELQNIMNGTNPYDEVVYSNLKKLIIDCGMNKEGKWNIPFHLIETHASGDLNNYLTVCENEFRQMPEELKAALFPYFHQTINTKDKEILKRAIRFMRAQLPDLHTSTIYFGITSLMQLEKEMGTAE